MTQVLLINPWCAETPSIPPLGLAYVAAAFELHGCSVQIVDFNAPYCEYDDQALGELVAELQPSVVGMSVYSFSALHAYALVRRLRTSSDLLVAGGPHATVLPREALEAGFDVVVRGEAEETIGELVSHVRGDRLLREIKGISYRSRVSGSIVDNPPRSIPVELDKVPLPNKELFRAEYSTGSADAWRFGGIVASRGCPGRCTFCFRGVFGNQVRYRSVSAILEEIQELRAQFGISSFFFYDDTFTASQKRVKELCQRLGELDFSVSWQCSTRVDSVRRHLLREMRSAGCTKIEYGVESGNPDTLRRIDKRISLHQAREVISWTNDVGIACTVNFILGFPWEDPQDIAVTRRFIQEISPSVKRIQIGTIVPLPETSIYKQYSTRYQFADWWKQGPHRSDTGSPVYRRELFRDPAILRRNFFGYSRRQRQEIRKTIEVAGRHNLNNKYQRGPVAGMMLWLCKLSDIVHRISPPAERVLLQPFHRLILFLSGLGNP